MTALLIDMDGVLYVGDQPVEGAADAVAWLVNRGVPHLFLTNTTSRPRAQLVAKLAAMGIATTADRILTPPVAAVRWLGEHAPGPVALCVPGATREDFAVLPQLDPASENGATAVVLGDLGTGWDFATYNRAFRLLMAEPRPRLVALGMTRYWHAAGGLQLDVGPFVVGLEYATGLRAVVLGKPAPAFFETALAQLKAVAAEAIMIGDDIVGDIGGAQQAGIRGVLVRTGKFRVADLAGESTPDAVLDSFAALPRWLQAGPDG